MSELWEGYAKTPTPREMRKMRERQTKSELAAASGSARSLFEQWISSPPYERETERWPQDETKHSWPGQYKDIDVQLAWEAWQQAQNTEVTDRKDSGSVR